MLAPRSFWSVPKCSMRRSTTADGRRGTFLPQVWETLPRPQLFLRELAKKAGLAADTRLARCRVSRYRVIKWAE